MGCRISRKRKMVEEENARGPDQILPAYCSFTSAPETAVKLQLNPVLDGRNLPISLPGRFMQVARQNPTKCVMAYKPKPTDPVFKYITINEYLAQVRALAQALIEMRLDRHRCLLILSRSCHQWNVAFFAAIFAGGIAGGLDPTFSAEMCFAACNKTRPQILVVENEFQAAKILEYRTRMPYVRAIIQLQGLPKCVDILTWAELMRIGFCMSSHLLDRRLKGIAVNHCCVVNFTQKDLNGEMKAAMLSHDSVNHCVRNLLKTSGLCQKDRVVSHMPLSSITAQIFDIFGPICYTPYTVYFPRKDDKQAVWRQVKPTVFVADGVVASQIANQIKILYADAGSDSIYQWALTVAHERFDYLTSSREEWDMAPHIVANHLVYRKIRAALGFCHVKACLIGPESVEPYVIRWWLAAGIFISQLRNMIELSGGGMINVEKNRLMYTAGVTMPGVTASLLKSDDTGKGQLWFSGRTCFMGYMNDSEGTATKTAEVHGKGMVFTGLDALISREGVITVTGPCDTLSENSKL